MVLDPKPGEVYRHYKGGLYTVIGIGQHTESGERLVAYRDDDGKIWFRPVSMFSDLVSDPKTIGGLVRRFIRLTDCGRSR